MDDQFRELLEQMRDHHLKMRDDLLLQKSMGRENIDDLIALQDMAAKRFQDSIERFHRQ
ncbi:hypothetical protein GOC38_14025 [Sinorhizobium meliloti]|nr:hypothetical protein [Sinorhizobium meliloti]MDX0325257.1 hypothetical protein [Sinorhizobium meliloti]